MTALCTHPLHDHHAPAPALAPALVDRGEPRAAGDLAAPVRRAVPVGGRPAGLRQRRLHRLPGAGHRDHDRVHLGRLDRDGAARGPGQGRHGPPAHVADQPPRADGRPRRAADDHDDHPVADHGRHRPARGGELRQRRAGRGRPDRDRRADLGGLRLAVARVRARDAPGGDPDRGAHVPPAAAVVHLLDADRARR